MKDWSKLRIGQISKNAYGTEMKIVEYINTKNITVLFENGYKRKTTYTEFKSGELKSPYDKTMYGVGYVGEGEHLPCINSKLTPQYKKWTEILNRCYNRKNDGNLTTYEHCKMSDDWHNFQNFAKWYDENYYEISHSHLSCKMHIDKDILVKGNKVYSPETCVFVPQFINNIFTKRESLRGECVIGVRKVRENYVAQITMAGKKHMLGTYKNELDAFYKYKQVKEGYIKEVANENKQYIPLKLYEALMNYEVDITD
jgi:hypothetical protein